MREGKGMVEVKIELDKKYKCVASCPELDIDNIAHCKLTGREIYDREERIRCDCPCGNNTLWVPIEHLIVGKEDKD